MRIRSRGSVTKLGGNWPILPSGEAGYLYKRELPQSKLEIQMLFAGRLELREDVFKSSDGCSLDEILIDLDVDYNYYGNDGWSKSWRGLFTSRELLLDEDAQTIPPLSALDMSLEEIEQIKLEVFQTLIDELDKIEDASDAPGEIEKIAENSGLWLIVEQ